MKTAQDNLRDNPKTTTFGVTQVETNEKHIGLRM